MLIKTINELRTYLPAHTLQSLESMLGFFRNSEQDFLRERLGAPLLTHLYRYYDSLPVDALVTTYDDPADAGIDVNNPWYQLLCHAQRCVVYNAFERAADINAVSVSNSGINLISADGYDSVSKDFIKAYKDRLWKETHNAADQMLVFLEELETHSNSSKGEGEDELPSPGETPKPPLEEDPGQAADYSVEIRLICELWQSSRYYYLADGLLINTACRMQDFIDIEENRERFIQMLPDMRFIQRNYLRTEVGDVLFDRLLSAVRDGAELRAEETEIVYQLKELLALYTQERSRVFKFSVEERKRIEEECIGLKRELLKMLDAYRAVYNDDGSEKEPVAPDAPEDNAPEQNACCGCCSDGQQGSNSDGAPLNNRYWGDKGKVFVMPGLI